MIKKVIFLFCFMLVISFGVNNIKCYAILMDLVPGSIFYKDGDTLQKVSATVVKDSSSLFNRLTYSNKSNASDLEKTIVNTFCSRYQSFHSDEPPTDLGEHEVPDMYINYNISSIYGATNVYKGPLSAIITETEKIINDENSSISEPYQVTFSLKTESNEYFYAFSFYTANYGIAYKYIDSNGEEQRDTKYLPKNEVRSFCTNPPSGYTIITSLSEADYKILEAQYKIAMDSLEGFKMINEALKVGLIAGSIGAGYNVGTVYSTSQISLSDAMKEDESGNGFDFKNQNALKTSFAYYMSPLLGKVEFIQEEIPTDITSWVTTVQKLNPNFLSESGYDTIMSDEFTAFESGLTDDKINSNGLKKTQKAQFSNGVKALKDVGTSKNPGSVISYNMKIAYPYIFYRVGNNYKLLTNSLKLEEEYQYCIYDDFIRDNELNKITNRDSIGISRDQLFLYYQLDSQGKYIGVLLIGSFDECVIDTSDDNKGALYATGRKIGFNNGYSDLLVFDDANPMLMYSTSDGGKKGYLPKNTAFLLDTDEEEAAMHNMSIHPQAILEKVSEYKSLNILNNSDLLEDLKEMGNHDVINTNPQLFKFNILFTQIINQSGVDDIINNQSSGGNGTNNTTKLSDADMQAYGVSHYSFVMIRNNRYINDAELISWLKTDNARSIPYVDAEELLNKITGNFLNNLDKLTYEDWQSMQSIKSQLEQNKDMWLIRVINVMAIIMGVFLIVFAILICLAYWVDIFNTLADFSILQFISFGNLYPVESKDLIPYVSESKSSTKYVTFKDVLIIAGICCGLGIIFMNTFTLVSWIIYLYNYIMSTLGGV